jgi:hypothetical protein
MKDFPEISLIALERGLVNNYRLFKPDFNILHCLYARIKSHK